jgi:hypothetical protein
MLINHHKTNNKKPATIKYQLSRLLSLRKIIQSIKCQIFQN